MIGQYDKEIVERMRRVEKRLTRYFLHVGFDSGSRHAVWCNGCIDVPTMDISLKEVLAAVPSGWQARTVDIRHKGNSVGKLVPADAMEW